MLRDRDIIEIFGTMELLGIVMPKSFVDRPTVAAAARAWASVLSDVDVDELREAMVVFARNGSKFFPSPGELLKLVPRFAAANVGDADEDWGELMRLLRRYGWPNPPTRDGAVNEGWRPEDLAVARRIERGIAALGGWQACCKLETDDLAAARASFRSVMRGVAEQDRNARLLGEGPGLRLLDGGRDLDARLRRQIEDERTPDGRAP